MLLGQKPFFGGGFDCNIGTYPRLNCNYSLLYVMIRNIALWKSALSSAKEWIEPEHQIISKTKELAQVISKAKYPILFTGAGCSTSVGIPDYRSGADTVVGTGPGIWNRQPSDITPKLRIDEIVDKAVPSLTHMAIQTLIQRDVFKYLVSQNTDGLHLRSGIGFNKISELHGNRNLQKCLECGRKYFRDFRTIKRGHGPSGGHDHKTGRNCENCGGELIDSIVYFGQKLPTEDLKTSLEQASKCDLLLCIGSSLTVRPSANIPILAHKNNASLCIINIQETPFDPVTRLKIHGFCDPVMDLLMKQLGLAINVYRIQRYLNLEVKGDSLVVEGRDRDGNGYTYVKGIAYAGKEYQPVGYATTVPLHGETEVTISFYGNKSDLQIYLPAFYKLYHGEQTRLKLSKTPEDESWRIEQL